MDPFISVVMPVRNEADHLVKSLAAVLSQDYPAERLEVLVVDGMSEDGTRQVVQSFQKTHSCLRLLDNPVGIVATGMNTALRRARGDIIVRVDGHTVIAPDYIRRCVEALQRTGADNAGGRMDAVGTTFFGKVTAAATSSFFGIGGGRFHYSEREEWVDTVYMGAWPWRVFEKIGLFDEDLVRNQDDEFNYRLRAAGGKILLDPMVRSVYTTRSKPKTLWRQYFQYGFWKVRVLQKHPRQMSLRQFVPPAFVVSLIASALLGFFPASRYSAFFIPALYLLANLTATAVVAAKKGWRYLRALPFVFAILHLSYGMGFLAGLIHFWNRWGDRSGKTPALERAPGGGAGESALVSAPGFSKEV
jgi:succinoglycan biosynthesis protein ExoA